MVGFDYQHVRRAVARVSGNGVGGGSIGGEQRCNPRQKSHSMPETAPPAGASASQDAEITAALGTRSVVLVGMMGAGKSTIGRRLSARLRLGFLGGDIEIEGADRTS